MKIIFTKDYDQMSKMAARYIAGLIRLHPESTLGLATGSSPIGTYKELVKQYEDENLDFSRVTSFNLDEYVGIDENHPQSYKAFMNQHLFNLVNIDKDKVFVPNGSAEDLEKECARYEKAIEDFGGIDLQILGIGRNGHIGFNEPNFKFEARTHVVNLEEQTIEDNSRFFENREDVPTQAISVGMKTILQARRVIVIASGIEKAEAVRQMVSGEIIPGLPASILQLHPDTTLIVDEAASSLLEERGKIHV